MVKGVNKSVIEINDTGSEIFDRIVFFVSPKYGNLSAKKLKSETEKFTFQFDARAGKGYRSLRQRAIIRKRLIIASAVTAAVGIAATIVLIII